jgi:polyketide biosynthesis enoyl-CoA hydratase PksI
MLGGQYFRGSHFDGRGQVNYVLPRDKVWRKAVGVARRMADKPRHALELLKRQQTVARLQRFQAARNAEAQMHRICFDQPETRQRIKDEYVSDE